MTNHKIIFTGPVGAGKTTAITSLSDIPVITTDECASDMKNSMKPATTVAMDYGLIKLDDDRIHLYGTPGQERFNFMWDILIEGGIGLVLLLDHTRKDPIQDMKFFINSFRTFIDGNKVAVGVTRMDINHQPMLEDYRTNLGKFNLNPPVFEIDARRRQDVSTLVQALLYSLDPWLVE